MLAYSNDAPRDEWQQRWCCTVMTPRTDEPADSQVAVRRLTSRAVVQVAPRQLELREVQIPDSLNGGALIRVEGNGLCGSDLETYSGRYEKSGAVEYPLVVGHEFVGRVAHIDAEASSRWGVAVGSRVAVDTTIPCAECPQCRSGHSEDCTRAQFYGHISLGAGHDLSGGMADYVHVLPRSTVLSVPEHVGIEDAVLFNPLGNALSWIAEAGQLAPDETVMIFGAGQRALLGVVAARTSGAGRIVVCGRQQDRSNLDIAAALGADEIVFSDSDHGIGHLANSVDLALDVVPGSPEPLAMGIAVLRPRGRMVVAGVKGRAVPVPTDQLFMKRLELRGARGTSPRAIKTALEVIATSRGLFDSLHSHTFELADAQLALRTLAKELPGTPPIHITVTC
jgi:threonine dehydrogenase-like Zn-dependent dehydrogenase